MNVLVIYVYIRVTIVFTRYEEFEHIRLLKLRRNKYTH